MDVSKFNSLDNLQFILTPNGVRSASKEDQDTIRDLCRTNLRFLANCVLRPASRKFISLSEKCHGKIIDNCLRPDFGKPFEEWGEIKEWVTIASRGILKSTLVAAFLVQLQLCDPDIRILIVSGKLTLAQTILQTACQPFVTNEVLRFLFPNFAANHSDLSGDEYTSPARDKNLVLRDPTLSVATFESVKAGGHFEFVLFDDCTNEINSATPELVEKNEQCYDDTDPLVEPGGYRHFWGTRWAPDDSDVPEVIRRRGDVYAEEHNGEKNTSYLCLPVWTLREGKDEIERAEIEQRDRRNQLKVEDVILTWPEKLSSKVLWPKYRANPVKFHKQYLMRFAGHLTGFSFTRDILIQNTRPFEDGAPLPHDRFLVINWDLSGVYSGNRSKTSSDFACGFAGMFEQSTKRLFLYDAVLEVFGSSTDMSTAIVDFYQRQTLIDRVGICSIEDTNGARNLAGEIDYIAKARKLRIDISWNVPENKADQKNISISQLAGAMQRGLVQFATNMPQREDIFRQFEKWNPNHKRAKDDAPDCAAQIWKYYSPMIFPNMVMTLSSGQILPSYEPEIPEQPDPHADERESVDYGILERMTVPHT